MRFELRAGLLSLLLVALSSAAPPDAAAQRGGSGKPGQVLAITDEGITIAGNGGAILAKRVKTPETKKISAAEWAKSVGLVVGDICSAPQPKAPA